MAIISTALPEKVSLARSPIRVKLESNMPLEERPVNRLRLAVTGNPAVGEEITIGYGGISETFVVQNVADNSGRSISQQGGLSLVDYAEQIAIELQRNFNLYLNFNIFYEQGAQEYVYVEPREDRSSDFSIENGLTNIDDQIILSSNQTYEGFPSLTLFVQIYNSQTDAFDILLPHVLPLLDYTVEFEIDSDFELHPHLPAPSSIGIGGDYMSACQGNWTKYKLSWAERKGSPAVTEGLQTDDKTYFAVYAGNDFFHQYNDFWSFWRLNGKFCTAAPRVQTITYEQPMWLYWIGRANRDAVIAGRLTRRSGASENFTRGAIEEVQGEMFVIKAGFTQLQLPDDVDDPVVRYTLFLRSGEQTISEVFTLNITGRCAPWTRYFLFANSLGGCDTVRATGKHSTSLSTETQEGSRITSADLIQQGRGEDFHYNRRSRVAYEGSVGYKSEGYISYLQDFLNAPAVWIVDVNAARFTPVLIEPGNIDLLKDDEDLYTLRFSYAHAWQDAHLGVTDDGNRIITSQSESEVE